jgi:hypothetical protein
MTNNEYNLDPKIGVFDRRRLFSDRAIWTFAFVGLAVVIAAFSGLWDFSGYLVDEGTTPRFIVVFAAAIYGLILGWMVFPRVKPGA